MLQLWINFVQHSNPAPNPGTLHRMALSMSHDIHILYDRNEKRSAKVYLIFSETDPLVKNFVWKPLAAGKQQYAVIESAVEFRDYDEDMILRSGFWKTHLEDSIGNTTP